jgi:hypothetical protein
MGKTKRSEVDRRSGEDRRQAYDLEHFLKGGEERRMRFRDRRRLPELRRGWMRISLWHSQKVESDA